MEIYRQSVIQNYLGCNRSLKFKDFETPPSQAMINGKIFEGLLLGQGQCEFHPFPNLSLHPFS